MNYKKWLKATLFCVAGVFTGYSIYYNHEMKTYRNVIIETNFEKKDFDKKLMEMLTEYDIHQLDFESVSIPARPKGKVIYINRNSPLKERRLKIIKSVLYSDKNSLDLRDEEIDNQAKYYYKNLFGDD